ncbi:sulfatase [Oceaniferula spumae]|uniref:Sulfatase n=1 Tax=Oceaniferula spumae TaxID=2979115 RepID=A0AAT9FPM7_9BACT
MKQNHPCPGNPFASDNSRREFLHVGLLAGLGLTLPQFLKMEAQGAQKTYTSKEGVAKSVIQIFLPGGLAQQESFDPKPYAPSEYRGPFGSIPTKLKGERFGEHMKELAKVADMMTVIRSMSHGEAAHERGTHNMFTGYRPSPALQFPSMGSVVSHELGPKNNLPPYVCVPNVPNIYANSGYLSSAFGPFGLGADPAQGNFKVRDLNLPNGVDDKRFHRRKSMLETVDGHFRSLEKSDALDSMDSFYQHAYKLISSQKAREAFDLSKESDKIKEMYGKNQAGQRMLLARRLAEAGVRFISLTAGGWDHHDNIKNGIQKNLPSVDKAVAALLQDLKQRGMLDNTLVLLTSEFGRTPKINKTNGRDHWPRVFSVMLAGGGVKSGLIYGKSNALAAEPEEDKVGVQDLAKTVYNQIGINADKELMAPGGRPMEIVDGGEVLNDILV